MLLALLLLLAATTADAGLTDATIALIRSGQLPAAAAQLEAAYAADPEDVEAVFNLAMLNQQMGKSQAALGQYSDALRLKPSLREAHVKKAQIHRDLGELSAVVFHLEQAIKLEPNNPNAYGYLGDTLNNLKRFSDAIEVYEKALALQESPAGHRNVADTMVNKKDYEGAKGHFQAALALAPSDISAMAGLWHVKTLTNDWQDLGHLERHLVRTVERQLDEAGKGGPPSELSPYRAVFLRAADERLRARVSASWAEGLRQQQLQMGLKGQRRDLGKIWKPRVAPTDSSRKLRVGYLSRRFEDYPGTELMLRVFGLHRREQVEVFAYANGPDDHSEERATVKRDADRFRDISMLPPASGARAIAEDGIDVLIDYDGHHDFNSLALLARRPAPLQLTWLGFPGPTVGRNLGIDYVIADPVVVPVEAVRQFGDRVLWLPGAYQPQDHQQIVSDTPTRAEAGLPPQGSTVYACFNRMDKADALVFDVWMQMLRQDPGSVLWLFKSSDESEQNLRAEAAARGVLPSRLVFAPRKPKEQHLARHQLADLFLDTLAYNAHTTASDAMWAGLPVLTLPGETFSARVGASLVDAAGMPELISTSLKDYAELAVRSGRIGPQLQQSLARRRPDHTLFHTEWFTCGLEHAYRALWTQRVAGGNQRRLVRVAGPMPGSCDRHLARKEGRVSAFMA